MSENGITWEMGPPFAGISERTLEAARLIQQIRRVHNAAEELEHLAACFEAHPGWMDDDARKSLRALADDFRGRCYAARETLGPDRRIPEALAGLMDAMKQEEE